MRRNNMEIVMTEEQWRDLYLDRHLRYQKRKQKRKIKKAINTAINTVLATAFITLAAVGCSWADFTEDTGLIVESCVYYNHNGKEYIITKDDNLFELKDSWELKAIQHKNTGDKVRVTFDCNGTPGNRTDDFIIEIN